MALKPSFAVPGPKAASGEPSPESEKQLKSNIAQTENSTVFLGKMPLLVVFWLAYGLSTVLVDPPGLTARSSTACHAPRTPARPSEGTLRPCGHCAKRLSHSVLRPLLKVFQRAHWPATVLADPPGGFIPAPCHAMPP